MIPLPTQLKIKSTAQQATKARVEITPLYPGFGHTLGNSLRRVLLSSLTGAGITLVKIQGADHEFMALPHIKEEVLEIILNLKQLNLKLHTDEPEKLTLEVKGKKKVTAAAFKHNPNIEIANPNQLIATLTHKDAELIMEATVEKGIGFSPVEDRKKEVEVGVISIDTVFSPIKSIGYTVEDVRVGKRTDYDKLLLDIETNGTLSVHEAMHQAAEILVQHFNFVFEQTKTAKPKAKRARASRGDKR